MRLTRANIARMTLPAGKSEHVQWDEGLPGFGLRVRAGGKRTWIVQYRAGGRTQKQTLGSAEVIDPDEARKAARATLAKVHLGGDPQAEKADARTKAAVTLGFIARRYLDEYAKPRLKPRSYTEVERHLTRNWAPLKGLPAHEVKRINIAARLAGIASEHGKVQANRSRASLSALFSWAIREGLVDANPVVATNKAIEETSREHVLSDSELVAIWSACRDDDYGRILRLLMLTAARREEVGAMANAEVDAAGALWTIPRERTKNGLEHEVPLSALALEVLKGAPRRDGRSLMFGEGEGAFQGWSRAKVALDDRIAKAGAQVRPWRVHDIRRTVATRLGDLGTLPHVVEAILNHVSGHKAGVAGVYNRALYRPEKRDALKRWAAHLATLVADGYGI